MKKITVILVFLITSGFSVFTQFYKTGIPFIRNYTPVETTGSEQNWAVVEDPRGVMYFGNNDAGVLEYDGVNWRNIPAANNSIVRSLAVDSLGTVYVGAVGEFGYLAPNTLGKLDYISLTARLDSSDLGFTNVWKTYYSNSVVYYCSEQKVFKYYPETDKLITYNNKEGTFMTFITRNKLYQTNQFYGLMEVVDDSAFTVKGGEFFIQKYITCILPFTDDELFVGTVGNGAFIFNPETGRLDSAFLSDSAEVYLNQKILYQGIRLDNNRIALATLYGGIVILNHNGDIIQKFDKNTGLQDETVLYVYTAPGYEGQNPFWFALNIGISKAEINSPIRLFDEKSGLNGSINDIIRYNDTLLVATSSGVYYMIEDELGRVRFQNIGTINTQCWSFLVFNNGDNSRKRLLLATISGLYDVTDKNLPFIIDRQVVNKPPGRNYYLYTLSKSIRDSSVVYLGGNTLVALKYEKGTFYQTIEYDFQDEIRSIAEDDKGNLWLATSIKGIIELDIASEDTIIRKYTTEDGLPSLDKNFIYHVGEEIVFATVKGIYRYNHRNDYFYPDSVLVPEFEGSTYEVFRIAQDTDGDYWLSFNKDDRWREIYVTFKDGIYHANQIPFLRLPNKSTDAIYGDKNGIVWLGKSTELYRYDKNFHKDYHLPYLTLIRRVTLGEDSVIFYGTNYGETEKGELIVNLKQPDILKPIIKYKHNNLTFRWAAPFFENEEATEYRYWLEGNDRDWTLWTNRTEFPFTNLRQGHYIFHVQAKNVYGIESEIATYEFTILPPWYQTMMAYILYVILAVVLVIIIVKLYTRKLKLENIKLEGIIAERTAEIRAQKKELTDSIEYASRIQRALLPSQKILAENLPMHFILFKPRDIVSGDFYWMTKKNGKIFVVAADCTGHGVPGAFMSMLGISFLNEIANKMDINRSDEILNELRTLVMESLKQKGETEDESKDGMDLALCVIDKKKMKIEYSGAYNPLYLVRPLTREEKTLVENGGKLDLARGAVHNHHYILNQVRADTMPIGISAKGQEPFTCHELDLVPGYSLYMFSDGYIDQFGGPSGKKLMTKAFKEILLDIQDIPMVDQGEVLNNKLQEWMKNIAQVDDIIVIGIQLDEE